MRVLFLGTPAFSVKVLDSILRSTHEVVGVITQPDKVNDRNGKINFSKVKEYAIDNGLPVMQFNSINKDGEEVIKSLHPDVMVTCAYGQIIKQNILDICPIINVHASLLPAYRGSSPVQWALINGEDVVGVTIMKTELGVDTGDIILQKGIRLNGDENTDETLMLLSKLGGELIVEALDLMENGKETYKKQDEQRATHCRMLTKNDGLIDFSKTAVDVKNFIRGMTPWPSAFTTCVNGRIKIIKVSVVDYSGGEHNGEIVCSDIKDGLIVKCGTGYIRIDYLQGENSRAMDAKSYLLGKRIPVGSILGE